jgi:hypothetical protein
MKTHGLYQAAMLQDAVVCRGVLNDILCDEDRQAATDCIFYTATRV